MIETLEGRLPTDDFTLGELGEKFPNDDFTLEERERHNYKVFFTFEQAKEVILEGYANKRMFRDYFVRKVEAALVKNGEVIEDLAQRVGVIPLYLKRLIGGEGSIPSELVPEIACALRIGINELLPLNPKATEEDFERVFAVIYKAKYGNIPKDHNYGSLDLSFPIVSAAFSPREIPEEYRTQ